MQNAECTKGRSGTEVHERKKIDTPGVEECPVACDNACLGVAGGCGERGFTGDDLKRAEGEVALAMVEWEQMVSSHSLR
jgi:hypothetical protein